MPKSWSAFHVVLVVVAALVALAMMTGVTVMALRMLDFDEKRPAGLFLMMRYRGTGQLETSLWSFGNDGRVHYDPRTSLTDGEAGTVAMEGDRMLITWSDGKKSDAKIFYGGKGFLWDEGFFILTKPFATPGAAAGRWAKRENVLELRADGTYVRDGISGRWTLDGYSLTLTAADGTSSTLLAVPYEQWMAFDGEMYERAP
jgi:hypothetical protein